MKWIKTFSFLTPLPKPLGRWSQCGDKKTLSDVLEFKIRQKSHRQYLLETGIDPYQASSSKLRLYQEKHSLHTEEEYIRPFVVQS
jgi:hypothetical protein